VGVFYFPQGERTKGGGCVDPDLDELDLLCDELKEADGGRVAGPTFKFDI
jgi:hypothetical protein